MSHICAGKKYAFYEQVLLIQHLYTMVEFSFQVNGEKSRKYVFFMRVCSLDQQKISFFIGLNRKTTSTASLAALLTSDGTDARQSSCSRALMSSKKHLHWQMLFVQDSVFMVVCSLRKVSLHRCGCFRILLRSASSSSAKAKPCTSAA